MATRVDGQGDQGCLALKADSLTTERVTFPRVTREMGPKLLSLGRKSWLAVRVVSPTGLWALTFRAAIKPSDCDRYSSVLQVRRGIGTSSRHSNGTVLEGDFLTTVLGDRRFLGR